MKQVIALMGLLCLAVPAQAVMFFDGTFDNAQWTTTKFIDTTPTLDATGASEQVGSGGNPGSARQTTHHWRITSSGVSIAFAHMNSAFSFDPGAGLIQTLTVQYDFRLPSSVNWVNTVGTGPMLSQGGALYSFAGGRAPGTDPSAWLTYQFDGSSASIWNKIDGGGHPDFNSGGAPIFFGYYTSNGGSGANIKLTAVSQTDNFQVDITATPIPTPSAGLMMGVVVLACAGRRKA